MKTTIIAISIAVLIIGGVVLFMSGESSGAPENAHNVTIANGKQIVDISVKGGYHPQISTAKAGIPTILRFDTNGTFDCSSSIRIPSLGINKLLPQTGTTDIDLGTPTASTLNGTCGMGMYSFQVNFQT